MKLSSKSRVQLKPNKFPHKKIIPGRERISRCQTMDNIYDIMRQLEEMATNLRLLSLSYNSQLTTSLYIVKMVEMKKARLSFRCAARAWRRVNLKHNSSRRAKIESCSHRYNTKGVFRRV